MTYKLLIALLASVLAHIILVLCLSLTKNTHLTNRDLNSKLSISNTSAPVLQVGLLILNKPKLPLIIKKELHDRSNIIDTANAQQGAATITKQSRSQLNFLSKSTQSDLNDTLEDGLKQYFKVSEVDISAIPMHGIESPINAAAIFEVYKFRIFINKSGGVDKIVNLNETGMPQLFYLEVEDQLKALTFIPAKKNGAEVDSYIDIALEM